MDINAAIIDQQLVSIVENIRQKAMDELRIQDTDRIKSLAFVYLCVKTILDLEDDEAFDCLTEGGGDFGIDAMHVSQKYDKEFTVTLLQVKYSKSLEGNRNFPENGIKSLINAIQYLFNPLVKLEHINQRMLIKVEEVRSLIGDGYIPQVRVLACNNGLKWDASGEEAIKRTNFGDQVTWEHINHVHLVKILQGSKPVNDCLQLSGKAIIEDMEFSRVLVGKISVAEVAALIKRHGERLLERNIRRYLGLYGNRVNEAIRNTLMSPKENKDFYFYNNGITLICENFLYNALQNSDHQVQVENLQIINGGQTCMTIFQTLRYRSNLINQTAQSYVLLRLYQLPRKNEELVQRITYATNSQNPVDLKDLRANDELQQRLEMDIKQLGFTYHRKRVGHNRLIDITSGVAAEAILSVWRQKPHQAKFFSREHFGKLYGTIFTNELNGAQVVIAVQLYRIAENRRKIPNSGDPDVVRYASCFIAMQMGRKLLADLDIQIKDISHQNFEAAQDLIKENSAAYFDTSLEDIQLALQNLYGAQQISLQQLSATFRRGDLISIL